MSNYNEKLKKELFKKIPKYHELLSKIYKIETEALLEDLRDCNKLDEKAREEIDSEMVSEEEIEAIKNVLKEPDRMSAAEERKAVSGEGPLDDMPMSGEKNNKEIYDEFRNVQKEINILLIELKLNPLIGLTEKEDELVDSVELCSPKKYAEKYLIQEDEKEIEERKNRLISITPLILINFEIDPKTIGFYRQVLKCYVYGYLEASCVLCRAIVETMAKKYIEYKGYGKLLSGKDGKSKTMSLPNILANVLGLNKEILKLYNKIVDVADKILHRKDTVTEDKALDLIKCSQEFIKRFPKIAPG